MKQKKLTDEQMAAINELKAAIAKVEDLDVELLFEASEGWLFAINGDGNDGVVSENELMNEYDDDVERVELDWNLTECVIQPTCRNTDFDGGLYLIKQ
jgi:hypothetical protein